jgi:hypothetical protein
MILSKALFNQSNMMFKIIMIIFLEVPLDLLMHLIVRIMELNLICLKFRIRERKLKMMSYHHLQRKTEKIQWRIQRLKKISFQ